VNDRIIHLNDLKLPILVLDWQFYTYLKEPYEPI